MWKYRLYRCPNCGSQSERFLSDAEAHQRQRCGCGAWLKEAFGVPRAIRTDSTFMRGSHADDGFGSDERGRRVALAKARAAGVSTAGKKFDPQLCPKGEPFSPKAWVSGRDDVVARCREEGWGCSGAVNVQAVSADSPPKPYRIADELVERRVADELAGQTVSKKKLRETREKVREKLMPSGGEPG